MKEFDNKIVVVTGGAKGIGKCICRQFKEQGAIVCDVRAVHCKFQLFH